MLLTVNGRKSGLPRTTPVTLAEYNGQRYLIAPFGEVQWVRNVRAAGAAILSRGRDSEPISVAELPAAAAAPILKESLSKGPAFLRRYFDVTPTSPLADFEQEAPRHPGFLVQRAAILEAGY